MTHDNTLLFCNYSASSKHYTVAAQIAAKIYQFKAENVNSPV